jgi:hypothetical protein
MNESKEERREERGARAVKSGVMSRRGRETYKLPTEEKRIAQQAHRHNGQTVR